MGYGRFVRALRERWAHAEEKRTGKKIRASQTLFAGALGTDQSTVSKWENDSQSVDSDYLNRMMGLVGLSLEECLWLPEEIIVKAKVPNPAELAALKPLFRELVRELLAEEARAPATDRLK